jgi:hypothetical protein
VEFSLKILNDREKVLDSACAKMQFAWVDSIFVL